MKNLKKLSFYLLLLGANSALLFSSPLSVNEIAFNSATEAEKGALAQLQSVNADLERLNLSNNPQVIQLFLGQNQQQFIGDYVRNQGNIAYYDTLKSLGVPVDQRKEQEANRVINQFQAVVLNPIRAIISQTEQQAHNMGARMAEAQAGQKSTEATEMEKNRLAQVRDKVVSLGMNQNPVIMPLLTAIDHEIYNPTNTNGYLYNIGNIAYYTALQGANMPIAEDKMQKAKDSVELFVVNVLNPLDVTVKRLEEQAVAQAQAQQAQVNAAVQNEIVQDIINTAQSEKEEARDTQGTPGEEAVDVSVRPETVETQVPLEEELVTSMETTTGE